MLLVCSSPGQLDSCLGSPGMRLLPNLFFCLFFNFGNSVPTLPAVPFLLAELLVLDATGQAGLLEGFCVPC